MTNQISHEEVAHIAKLARLELSESDLERFAAQLTSVLAHVETIQRLDTDNVAPMTHALELSNVLRDDVVGDSLDRAIVLAQAPEVEDDRFRVPRILGEAL